MRAALRSEELQRLVRHIDSAVDGEAVRAFPRALVLLQPLNPAPLFSQALVEAMGNPRFVTFADSVLSALKE